MSFQDDTQPKAPDGLHENTSSLEDTNPRQPVAIPLGEGAPSSSCFSVMMTGGVLALAGCLCISIIALSGIAGVRDELRVVGTDAAVTVMARVETQYALGIQDFEAGNYELAEIRFQDVNELMPGYQDIDARLAEVRDILAFTPTPSPTSTLPPTAAPTAPAQTDAAPENPNQPDPADIYGRAETAFNQGDYEEAIRWFDALVLLDPNYRRAEVQELRLQAHIAQGRIYLRSQNEDGEDHLARGVQLINRASELGTVPGELLYEADFVARYLAARAYLEGGAVDQARELLIRLCEEDCDWSYRGVSVRSMLAQAGGG